MTRHKCIFCGSPAIAYLLGSNGERRPLCEAHVPVHVKPLLHPDSDGDGYGDAERPAGPARS